MHVTTLLIAFAAVAVTRNAPVTDSVARPAVPPAEAPDEAWFVEEWASITGPHIENSTTGGSGEVSLLTDVDGPGFDRAMRATFVPGRGESQVGLTLSLPDADAVQPREIWIEFHARWSPNWHTTGPHAGNPDHKFLFLFDQGRGGGRRWESNMGVFGSSLGHYISGNGQNHPGADRLWDGAWHRFRYHAAMDGPVWEVEVDGMLYRWSGDAPDMTDMYFKYVALSRNMNRGVDQVMSVDFGPVRVWKDDPGWR